MWNIRIRLDKRIVAVPVAIYLRAESYTKICSSIRLIALDELFFTLPESVLLLLICISKSSISDGSIINVFKGRGRIYISPLATAYEIERELKVTDGTLCYHIQKLVKPKIVKKRRRLYSGEEVIKTLYERVEIGKERKSES